uniref:Uncharacterized protein n=1 Tax=Candidatus Kentrum sp. DK TaxID=2126562 RepID=A0A450SC90_9GAMM|nr:MAG: hypothetical protein BECKDK2373C_GA0170839_102713 [Candidatus Kentron sp. DK]
MKLPYAIFGKSLLLSLLENYCDINKAERFDALFERLVFDDFTARDHPVL